MYYIAQHINNIMCLTTTLLKFYRSYFPAPELEVVHEPEQVANLANYKRLHVGIERATKIKFAELVEDHREFMAWKKRGERIFYLGKWYQVLRVVDPNVSTIQYGYLNMYRRHIEYEEEYSEEQFTKLISWESPKLIVTDGKDRKDSFNGNYRRETAIKAEDFDLYKAEEDFFNANVTLPINNLLLKSNHE
jgi:hypothetical protein